MAEIYVIPANEKLALSLPNINQNFANLNAAVERCERSAAFQTLTDGAEIDWDCSKGNAACIILGGSRTLKDPSNVTAGDVLRLIVRQDGAGFRTLAFGTSYKFVQGMIPSLSEPPDSIDYLEFVCDGSGMLCVNMRFNIS